MSGGGDPRQYVLEYLSEKCGFKVNESSDLSPDTRRRIGELAREIQGVFAADARMAEQERLKLKAPRGNGAAVAFGLFFVVGGVLGFASPETASSFAIDLFPGGAAGSFTAGILLFVLAGVNAQRRRRKIASVVAGMRNARKGQWDAWATRADALTTAVLEESRAAYQQKVKPRLIEVKVDFAGIMQAAQGKGVILDRVKCPSCGAAINLPTSGDVVRCSYCGNEITATSIFDKMKSILA